MIFLQTLLAFAGPLAVGLYAYRMGRRDETAHWCKFACVRCKVRMGEAKLEAEGP